LRDAGVVDEDVAAAEGLLDLLDQRLHLRAVADVAGETLGAAADLRGHGVRPGLVTADDRQRRAALGEAPGEGAADATRRAGDEGDFSAQIDLHARTLDG